MNNQGVKLTDPGSLVDRLVVIIRDSIISGSLQPGAHIGIKKIADAHAVSMIPVREALARLLASRLVEMKPNRGYFVASRPTSSEFAQFVQFRELFEVSAVSLGLDNVSDADIRQLVDLNAKMRQVKAGPDNSEMVEWGRLNNQFHQVLVGLSRNQFIMQQYENLSFGYLHFQLARSYPIEFTSLDILADQHDAMIDALQAGDRPLLLKLLSQHINNLQLED